MGAHDQILFACILVGAGVFIICASRPLIFRKVPMNRFYGIRLSDSFLSENRWYEINARSGKLMAGWAFAIIGVGLIGFVIPPETFPVYAVVATGIVLISVITPFFQIIRWARAMRS